MTKVTYSIREKIQIGLSSIMHLLGRTKFDPNSISIVSLRMNITGLDPVFNGYRIVQISDIHMGHWITTDRLNGIVDLVNEQKPEIVAITGDFVSYSIKQIEKDLIAGLRNLNPSEAKMAILGNHDHWMGADNVRRILQAGEVIDLSNDVYSVNRDGASFHIAGIDDVMANEHHLDVVLEKLPYDGPAILLAHEPDFAEVSAKTGRFALQLSGHSHGGQIVLPGIGPLIRGPYFFKYPNGLYQIGDMVQYTNRGIGTHVLRLRLNCPPEITVIELYNTDIV